MKFFITGATGFLGSAVSSAARRAGHTVKSPSRAVLSTVDSIVATLEAAEPDAVLHFAGSASVADSLANPLGDFESSTALTMRLLEGVRRSGLKPFIALASSAAVYGSPEELPTPETAALSPVSPYGFHKLLSEKVGEEFAECFGLSVVALRYFSIFGPRQKRLLVWELFDQLCRGEKALRLRGTGDEERDFLSEEEAARVTVSLVESLSAARLSGFRALNVASGESVTVREVALAVRELVGRDVEIAFAGQPLPGNPARWRADISGVKHILPRWNPPTFRSSLAQCTQAWKV